MAKPQGDKTSIGRPRCNRESPGASLEEAMISNGHTDTKGADDPDPVHMVPCGTFELRDDNTAGDGLNGSIRLDEQAMKAVGADQGDPVRVYAEANGRWIMYERETYSDRPGVGMPKSHREKLDLDSENRTITLWLTEAENLVAETEPDTEEGGSESGKQVSLTEDTSEKQEFVLIPAESPITYHHVNSSEDFETECGLDFEEKDHRKFTDPGDALDECNDCAIRSSDDMTNKELVEWLGEQAGFEANEGTPAYLSKGQLVALRDYILDLQEDQGQEPTNQASQGLTKAAAVSS